MKKRRDATDSSHATITARKKSSLERHEYCQTASFLGRVT